MTKLCSKYFFSLPFTDLFNRQLPMAATRNDSSWLQKDWEQNQGRSSQMRHYRAPRPCQKGASRNSLLQCNKMPVKTKQVDDTARQIRFKYGRSNLERELNKKNGTNLMPFVTKVQIRKTQERSRFDSEGSTPTKRRNESERVHSSSMENNEQTETKSDSTLNGDNNDEESYSSLETVDEKDETSEESMLRADIIAIQVNEKNQTDNYLYPETTENQLEDVQHLIKCLTRRLRDPFETSRKQIPSARPTAAYARPTKGEIALSVKGPVPLAPVTKVTMTTLRSHSPDKPSRLEARSLPEFVDSKAVRAHARPISSVSDSAVVSGKKIHGPTRATWAGREHAQNGLLDQKYHLCSSCRGHYVSGSATKITHERAKSAVSGDDRQRECHSCLPQLIRHEPTKLYSRNEGNRSASPKRQYPHNGMVSPFELQVHLAELNSYDYWSPGPPPSLSNSDDEITT